MVMLLMKDMFDDFASFNYGIIIFKPVIVECK